MATKANPGTPIEIRQIHITRSAGLDEFNIIGYGIKI